MIEQRTIPANTVSFKEFVLKNHRYRMLLLVASAIIIIEFVIFKYIYPYASYIHDDSFAYLETADKNLSINTYMIGYSMFLRAFSALTTSDTMLVVFQYLLLHSSALFLLFTLFYFYNPRKIIRILLLCFMLFNPLFLYMGNLVSSDAIFAALSVIWFTLLLWIIHRPSLKLIAWHTLVIFLAFTVRYNALIYIFISVIAFILSNQSLSRKVIGITLGIIAIALFVLHTGNLYKELTGTWQYSPFAGWQLANNAMYAYRYVDSADRKEVPKKFMKLDNMIRVYFDSTRNTEKFPVEKVMASTYYMWSPNLPLWKYKREVVFKNDTASSKFKKWASMGSLYKDYGLFIMEHYPVYFARYFLWPNAQKYYAPPVEYLENYNSGKDSVAPIAEIWFRYKSRVVKIRASDKKIIMLNFYPILSGVINVVMLLGLLSFTWLRGFRQNSSFRKGVFLGGSVWLLNAVFTIVASSVALRFQAFPILLSTVFMCLLLDWLTQMASEKQEIEALSNIDLPVTAPV